jgi:hypothetical protein
MQKLGAKFRRMTACGPDRRFAAAQRWSAVGENPTLGGEGQYRRFFDSLPNFERVM